MDGLSETVVVLDAAGRDDLLSELLVRYRHGLVGGLDPDGRVMEVPASVVLHGHDLHSPRSHLDLIDARFRSAAIGLLSAARAAGAARAEVVLVDGTAASCHLIDLSEGHGVMVGLITTEDDRDLSWLVADRPSVIPKSGRIDKDAVAIVTFADDRICRILGYASTELVGCRSLDMIHPDDHEQAINAWIEMLGTPGEITRVRARHRRHDGTWIWMELTNTNLLDGPEGRVVTEMVDVTDEMAALEALRQREELLRRLAEALPSGVLHVDRDRRVLYSNARLHRVVGVGPADTFAGQFRTIVADDRLALDLALDDVLVNGRDVDLEVGVDLPGATEPHRCSIAMRVLTDERDNPAGAVLCVDDITDAFALNAELKRRATVDDLTGCLNRTAVVADLEGRLGLHRNGSTGTVVVFLDLDGFKTVNDTFGHHVGDALLASVATRITSVLREGDVLGRLGGDEFIVVASAIGSEHDAMQLATRLGCALAEPVEIMGGIPMRIRAGIGVAWSSGPTATTTDLITAADRAMYRSKRAGSTAPVSVDV